MFVGGSARRYALPIQRSLARRRFRSTLSHLAGMVHRVRGKRGKRWAAELVSLATERLSPPPIFPLPLIRRRTSFRCRRQEAGEIPNDDHAVLSVVEAVHFHPYLLGEGLHLLAVDVDGYPAGAALCHDVKFWQRWPKRPSQDGTVNMIIKLKLVGELNFISELLTVHT